MLFFLSQKELFLNQFIEQKKLKASTQTSSRNLTPIYFGVMLMRA